MNAAASIVDEISGAKPRLGYLSGPVDARAVYRIFKGGGQTSLFGTSYLRHLMQVCEDQGRDAVIVTTDPGDTYEIQLGRFTILNRPMPGGRSLQYHWRQVVWTRQVMAEMEALGARTVVLTASQNYWHVTAPFRKRGMRFINAYHCAIRSMGHKVFRFQELFVRFTSAQHLAHGDPTLSASPLISRQLAAEPGHEGRRTWYFVADYDRTLFDHCKPASIDSDVIEIMFAGRVVENKGVFDLLEACERLNASGDRTFRFHIHGTGDALEELRLRASQSSVSENFIIHGFTEGSQLAFHYAQSHIVVVPTRSDFEEGFAMAVVEGVMALRPVVTSIACPALEVVRDACLEAQVDDVGSYVDAISRLANNPELFAQKVEAAKRLREDFFDPPNGYAEMLQEALIVAEA